MQSKEKKMKIYPPNVEVIKVIDKQLSNFWPNLYNVEIINTYIDAAMQRIENNYKKINIRRYNDGEFVIFSICDTVNWAVFLYYLSNCLYREGHIEEAASIYYLNKIMNSVEWFYEVNLPDHFMAEHPIGSILGKAKYGDYFMVYQGTTVGGNKVKDKIEYPIIGSRVVMYANSTVLGRSRIGNNVIISANTTIVNEDIPDDSMVFGNSPNLVIKARDEQYINRHVGYWD